MSHDPRFDELAMAYLTGDISSAEMIDFELRLKADASSRERLAELSEQEMALRQIFHQQENHRQLSPGSSIAASVSDTRRAAKSGLTRVRRSRVMRAQRSRRSGGLWVPLALAASLLLCVILFMLNRPVDDGNRVAGGTETPVRVPQSPSPRVPVYPGREQTPVGNVIFVAQQDGESRTMSVCRRNGDREQRLPLVEGMSLLAGDRIETGPREPEAMEIRPVRAAVAFADGATLDLADETNLEAISSGEVHVASGLLYAETKVDLQASALKVHTPHAEVRGAKVTMDVSVASGDTSVAVETGTVKVSNAEGAEIVGPGQKCIVQPGAAPASPVQVFAAAMWRGRKGPLAQAPYQGIPAVVSFTLIDADRDAPIVGFDPLPDGAVLNLSQLPTRHLNIRANTVPDDGISVRFDLDRHARFKLEQVAPYALNGDRDRNYDTWTPSLGEHTVTATPFPDLNGRGAPGKALRIVVRVVDQ